MRWNGNGLPDGTTITAGNVNTAGNGDTVTRAVSGTPTVFQTAGDGFEVAAPAGVIVRLDASFTPGNGAVGQLFYTPTSRPSTTDRIIQFRSSGANAAGLILATGLVVDTASGSTVGSPSPDLILGHLYQIDYLVALSASPSASNGRVVCRVIDLTDPAWGHWFYDTGYTVNAGTNNLAVVRFGKQATSAFSSANRFEEIGWGTVTVDPAATSEAAVSAYFLDPPARFRPVTADGVVTVSGGAVGAERYVRDTAGVVSAAGSATGTARYLRAATGSLTATGAAPVAAKVTAAGSATVTGSASPATPTTAAGAVTVTGSATATVRETRTATGTVTVAGVGSVTEATTANGTITITGVAVIGSGTHPTVGTLTVTVPTRTLASAAPSRTLDVTIPQRTLERTT